MRRTTTLLLAAIVSMLVVCPALAHAHTGDAITISGTWRIALDPTDQGREIIEAGNAQSGELWLPGSLQQQGFGDRPSADSPWTGDVRDAEWARPEYDAYRDAQNFKMPFWLQPERVYVGAAWYERTIEIPQAWIGQHAQIYLERVHWVSEAWIDGEPLGLRESLSTPHVYDLGVVGNNEHKGLKPGTHTLTLRIDNRIAYGVGVNAHSVTDHTQSNWNGVIGQMELRAHPTLAIESVRVSPHAASHSATALITIENTSLQDRPITLSGAAISQHAPDVSFKENGTVRARSERVFRVEMNLGDDAALWTEFSPHTYTLRVEAASGSGTHTAETTFGLRDVAHKGGRFTINSTPTFLRGTLDCAIYPLTGYAPMDTDSWERVFSRVKAFGLNHVRYHSWCPPHAAFLAADKLGVYLQVEGPFWVNQGPQLGRGQPIDGYVYEETDRILEEFGNHPSFVLMAYGNEPSGPGQGGAYLAEWIENYRTKDPRRLYTSGSGWPIIEASDFHVAYQPRIQRWGEGLDSTINSTPPSTHRDYADFVSRYKVPVLAHEIGQWCVFPNFAEMAKYTGTLKPKNFEIFRDLLAESGQGHLAEQFLMASGNLQLLCYKEEIEAALRTLGFGGFQLLDLHDFPGQGTALVGVLDPFWDPKPYVTAEAFREFCGPITPLARMPKRVYTSGEGLVAEIEVAQFGAADLESTPAAWTLTTQEGTLLASGTLGPADIPAGELMKIGTVRTTLHATHATKATLRVSIGSATEITNAWDLWVYPAETPSEAPGGVRVTSALDDDTQAFLESGGTVLLMADGRSAEGGVEFGFSPAFWNTAWTDGQAPHTLGITLDPDHPAFEGFPTGDHTDWQWWDLIGWPGAQAGAMVIDELPIGVEPLVRPIDTWFRSRRLASLFECRVGSGRLMVSTLDLEKDLGERPAAKRLRGSLMRYIASARFNPRVQVEPDAIRALFREPTPEERMGARVLGASSAQDGFGPELAMDGDPRTMWHSAWGQGATPHPHSITISLREPTEIAGLTYLARQTGGDNGKIGAFEVHTSTDGEAWTLVASGRLADGAQPQPIRFDRVRRVRFIRLTSLSGLRGGPHAAVAELGVLME